MASNFKNEASSITAGTNVNVYVTPALTQSIIIGFQISNTGATIAEVSVTAATKQLIGSNTPIPIGSALVPIEGKLVLEAADVVNVAVIGSDVDVLISILELT